MEVRQGDRGERAGNDEGQENFYAAFILGDHFGEI